jgi:hypothetical protein
MPLKEALALFRLLGVHVESVSRATSRSLFRNRYHPDRNPQGYGSDGPEQRGPDSDLEVLPQSQRLEED